MASVGVRKRVVVIGGGVAGLTAATTLLKSGLFDVTLLEADNRIGGRVQTLKLGNHFIENGAQWVHGNENNSVFLKVEPLGLLDTTGNNLKFDAHSIFVNQNGSILPKEKHQTLKKILVKLSHGPHKSNSIPDEPLGNWSERVFWEDEHAQDFTDEDKLVAAKVLDWQHRFQTGIDGSDSWYLPSCKGQQEYWECPGNPLNAWKPPASYSSLLNLILYDKPAFTPQLMPEIPQWIQLDKEVTKVDFKSKKEVLVECKDGIIYPADHVICTVSLGVLKEKINSLFSPSLPENKINAIKFLSIGTVNKLHFEFPVKWWPNDIIGFNLLWDQHDPAIYSPDVHDDVLTSEVNGLPLWCRGILGFYIVASHPTALNSWITGPTSRLMEKLDEVTVKTTFMKVLKTFVGSLYENIPEPEHFVRSSWYSKLFTRGSYSFRSVESEKHNVWATDIAEPIFNSGSPVICFAGEASHSHFYSTVHGAHDSGLREATRLINFVQGSIDPLSDMFPYSYKDFEDEESETTSSNAN